MNTLFDLDYNHYFDIVNAKCIQLKYLTHKCTFRPVDEMQVYLIHCIEYVEDICFSEVNTKYISSSELKTSEFSRVRNFLSAGDQPLMQKW